MKKIVLIIAIIQIMFLPFYAHAENDKQDSSSNEKVTVDSQILAQNIPAYKYSITKIAKEAERNLKKINKQLAIKAFLEDIAKKKAVMQEHYENAKKFRKDGDLQGAKEEYEKALEVANSPQMQEYLKNKYKYRKPPINLNIFD